MEQNDSISITFACFLDDHLSIKPESSDRDWAQVTVCMSDTEPGLGGELDFDTAMIKYAAWGFNLSRGEIVRLRSIIDTNNDDTLTAAQRAAITDQDILQLPGAASPLSSSWSGLSLVDILHTSYLRDNTDIDIISIIHANEPDTHAYNG